MITNSPNLILIIILLCQCTDFWVVKNITGRFLVKLRWWIVSKYNLDTVGIDVSEDKEVENILKKFYPESEKSSNSYDFESSEEEDMAEAEYQFVFESYDEEVYLSIINNHIFWISEISSAGFWALIFAVDILALNLSWVNILI